MASNNDRAVPMFEAVSSSARHLFQLLRCINFSSNVHVNIISEGLRFSADEARAMQGLVFLHKDLFTSYTLTLPQSVENEEDDTEVAGFQISLTSLLETLQIFGVNDMYARRNFRDPSYGGITSSIARGGPSAAFDNRILDMTGTCKLSYGGLGEPLCVILEEPGVTTTCELFTYEPELQTDIPLQKAKTFIIIMRASSLFDAITELSSTSPTRLTIAASPVSPFFTLSATGPLGSATVEFSKNPELLETFQVRNARTVNTYKYSLIKGASRAMAMASKVSIRGDEQGVLNFQFQIDIEGGGASYVDFRFVAFIAEEGDDDAEEEGEEGEEEEEHDADTEDIGEA